jgi:benzil reductase ((S)-benzoin forming)
LSGSEHLAIVTGSSSGIGRAVTTLLLDRGWSVLGVARRDPELDHEGYRHVPLDLSDVRDLAGTFERVVAPLLAADGIRRVGLVNNAAAVGRLGTIDGTDALEALGVYAVNVVSPLWLMGFVIRHTPRDAALRIVNVSSGAAERAFPGIGEYGSSKAALRLATLAAAADLDSEPLRSRATADAALLSYSPGTVDTPMQVETRSAPADVFPSAAMFRGLHENGQLVSPEEPAAEMVAFLESERAPRVGERRLGDS